MCCFVCTEYIKGTLTSFEAERAMIEVIQTDPTVDLEHVGEILKLIEKKEETNG